MNDQRQILVVEDSKVLAKVHERALKGAGFLVTVVTNGREAWAATQETQFDLIVTDYQMPEMSGGELCEKLRQTQAYAKTPIILVTRKSLELDLPRFQETWAVAAVFPKPFSPTELLRVVDDCLERLSVRQLGVANASPAAKCSFFEPLSPEFQLLG